MPLRQTGSNAQLRTVRVVLTEQTMNAEVLHNTTSAVHDYYGKHVCSPRPPSNALRTHGEPHATAAYVNGVR
jgi:hypothetical protein